MSEPILIMCTVIASFVVAFAACWIALCQYHQSVVVPQLSEDRKLMATAFDRLGAFGEITMPVLETIVATTSRIDTRIDNTRTLIATTEAAKSKEFETLAKRQDEIFEKLKEVGWSITPAINNRLIEYHEEKLLPALTLLVSQQIQTAPPEPEPEPEIKVRIPPRQVLTAEEIENLYDKVKASY